MPSGKVSPLGRYLAAVLAGHPEFASDHLMACAEQHASCPLYRQAFLKLSSGNPYPIQPESSDFLLDFLSIPVRSFEMN
jgi:hypothetical protein